MCVSLAIILNLHLLSILLLSNMFLLIKTLSLSATNHTLTAADVNYILNNYK